jgi:hypothetical protein
MYTLTIRLRNLVLLQLSRNIACLSTSRNIHRTNYPSPTPIRYYTSTSAGGEKPSSGLIVQDPSDSIIDTTAPPTDETEGRLEDRQG